MLKYLEGKETDLNLPLDIRVTAFQWKVYEALRAIPYGQTRTYEEIAGAIGRPKAVRAVARACATNPTAIVFPAIGWCGKTAALAVIVGELRASRLCWPKKRLGGNDKGLNKKEGGGPFFTSLRI